jgi:hypothetical protein
VYDGGADDTSEPLPGTTNSKNIPSRSTNVTTPVQVLGEVECVAVLTFLDELLPQGDGLRRAGRGGPARDAGDLLEPLGEVGVVGGTWGWWWRATSHRRRGPLS